MIRYSKNFKRFDFFIGILKTLQGFGITLNFDNTFSYRQIKYIFEVRFFNFKCWVIYYDN